MHPHVSLNYAQQKFVFKTQLGEMHDCAFECFEMHFSYFSCKFNLENQVITLEGIEKTVL